MRRLLTKPKTHLIYTFGEPVRRIRAFRFTRLVATTIVLAGIVGSSYLSHGVPSVSQALSSLRSHHRHGSRAGIIANTATAPVTSGDVDLLTSGQWKYLPAAKVGSDGVTVGDSNFAIVEQDGKGGQPNPPVNLYGTHAQVSGDFAVTAVMSNVTGQASLQLYGQVPLIQDEFRVERSSVRLTLNASSLLVQLWNGQSAKNLTKQTPATTATYSFTPQANNNIKVSDVGGQLTFEANGQTLGTMSDSKVFSSGQVWFGASDTGGSWLLSSLHASGTAQSADSSTAPATALDPAGLQAMATRKRPGFLVGAAMALAPMVSDAQYSQAALSNFGSMTTENALKWQFIEPQQNTFDFQEGDAMVAIAQKQHMAVHGHTLVFGEANPAWVTNLPTASAADKQNVQNIMTNHITTVMNHYKGQIATWDVVDEPLADYDTFDASSSQMYRDTVWFRAMGPSFIADAYVAAHKADPSAKLYINDYGLEAGGDRWDAFLKLMTQLKSQGVPIDGVGFEAHEYAAEDKIDPATLKSHIETLAKLGLTSRISEQDVYDDDGTAVQTQEFSAVFQACLSEPSCVSWTTWGVSDRYDMWQDDDNSLQYGNDFLWDKNMQPIPALTTVKSVLTSL